MALYSVIRYIPDPIAEEQINIGVIILPTEPGHPVEVIKTEDWERVHHFARRDVEPIQIALQELERDVVNLAAKQNPDQVIETIHRWSRERWNTVRLTEPRPALLPTAVLHDYFRAKFLHGSGSAVAVAEA